MDPQQRRLLEVAAEAFDQRRSGMFASADFVSTAATAQVGVYVGISSMDYQKLAARCHPGVTAYSATGVSLSVAAGRLSYTFGFAGPALAIDSACSSSLVAAHSAVLSLRSGAIGPSPIHH